MRSQSVSLLVNSIATPKLFRYGSENNLHLIRIQEKEVDRGTTTVSLSTNFTLNIQMDRQRIDAVNGQFVRAGCNVLTGKTL
jgi:hypothetical protein